MIKYKTNAKIYPHEKSTIPDIYSTQITISNWICQQYHYKKTSIINKYISGLRKLFGGSIFDNSDPYLDPNFIAIESLSKNHIIQLIEMFIDEEKTSFAYNDIAKYLRKYWYDYKIENYINEIVAYLVYLPDMSKYWFFEFFPLLGENGEKLILDLVTNNNIEGFTTELLYGIYLMEPKRLNRFYPEFLIQVNKSGSFNLWLKAGSYYENYIIINKLYQNNYNVFTNPILHEFWSEPVNSHSGNLIRKKLKLLYQ
jgi:hypothetical protein